MIEKRLKIRNSAGIHCRPSSMILEAVGKYENCQFKIIAPNGEAELNSILALLSLGIHCGDEATLVVDGENEEVALAEIGELFEREFDFPQE